MNYLDKIKAFGKITVTGICRDLHINRENLLNGRAKKENAELVYKELVKRLEDILTNDID